MLTKLTTDAEIIEAVLANFAQLTAIPRPSHHEKAVSDFLTGWARDHGFEARQDAHFNCIIDIPATPGMEDLPLCALQAHMDMVAVAADGVDYDPLTSPIKMVRDDEAGTLTADGTSLGADDGIGVAFIMTAAEGGMAHGPLRAIITTDEEETMSGVFNLGPDCLESVDYLINVDSEESDAVCVSTAAGFDVVASHEGAAQPASGDAGLVITIADLYGGHSGADINKGRASAVMLSARLVKALREAGIAFEVASWNAGTADNAIPITGAINLCVAAADKTRVEEVVAAFAAEVAAEYGEADPNITVTLADAPAPDQVVPNDLTDACVRYALGIINGVHTMSTEIEGLVESSSNLGIFKLSTEGFTSTTFIRSSSPDQLEVISRQQMGMAASCGFAETHYKSADAWPVNPDSKLVPLCERVYRELNGEDIMVVALHAGLECGTFSNLKPTLDMISIGPDLTDVHSPKETLYLRSIPKSWRLMEGILDQLA